MGCLAGHRGQPHDPGNRLRRGGQLGEFERDGHGPAHRGNHSPVYRFRNRRNGSYFYTASQAEKNSLVANRSATYSFDGIAYRVSSAYTTPLYRFYNRRSATHFYTSSVAERDSVIKNLSRTYVYEGVAYNVSATQVAGSTPVWRFYNKKNGSHFYTASEVEKNNVLATLSASTLSTASPSTRCARESAQLNPWARPSLQRRRQAPRPRRFAAGPLRPHFTRLL